MGENNIYERMRELEMKVSSQLPEIEFNRRMIVEYKEDLGLLQEKMQQVHESIIHLNPLLDFGKKLSELREEVEVLQNIKMAMVFSWRGAARVMAFLAATVSFMYGLYRLLEFLSKIYKIQL